jgi:hypothetical protein
VKTLLIMRPVVALALASPACLAQKKRADESWAEGVAYTTDWKIAIKSARESGRMLLIYNGWQRSGI